MYFSESLAFSSAVSFMDGVTKSALRKKRKGLKMTWSGKKRILTWDVDDLESGCRLGVHFGRRGCFDEWRERANQNEPRKTASLLYFIQMKIN